MKVTFNPSDNTMLDFAGCKAGDLIVDSQDRVFMVVTKPGNRTTRLVRISAPAGFIDAEATGPFRFFVGSALLENDQ